MAFSYYVYCGDDTIGAIKITAQLCGDHIRRQLDEKFGVDQWDGAPSDFSSRSSVASELDAVRSVVKWVWKNQMTYREEASLPDTMMLKIGARYEGPEGSLIYTGGGEMSLIETPSASQSALKLQGPQPA